MRAAGRAGRKPRLAPEHMAGIEAALRQGPRVHGFRTNLWTLPRVAHLIKRLTGVPYHPGHVWRLLGAIDWTFVEWNRKPISFVRATRSTFPPAWPRPEKFGLSGGSTGPLPASRI